MICTHPAADDTEPQAGGAVSHSSQQFVPRRLQRIADAAKHVYARIRRACLDSLDVAAVYFCESREVILRQPALHPQAVDVFAESDAR